MRMDITRYWYDKSLHPILYFLLPFSWLFLFVTWFRRWLYRVGILKTYHFSVPIIVVGNITVGGTGKTPLVIWLAHYLRQAGYRPGIVSRGVGGKNQTKPYRVKIDSDVREVGDEAILLANRSECPIVVGIDRVAAVHELLSTSHCDIVISDDGLQHERLGREIEIVVVDGVRRFGNHQLLPAGPLREPVSCLSEVDFVVVNGGSGNDKFAMSLKHEELVSLIDVSKKQMLSDFPCRKIHAVAAIGNPERFFNELRMAGFEIVEHVFQDHYLYQQDDLIFNDSLPIVMTEKDAVKCKSFANEKCWYLPVTATLNQIFQDELSATLKRENNNETESDFSKRICRNNDVNQPKFSGKSD